MSSRTLAVIVALASVPMVLTLSACTALRTTSQFLNIYRSAQDDALTVAGSDDPFRAVPGAELLPLEPVIQIGGMARDVVADGDVAFLAVGARIDVFDVSVPERPIVIGSTGIVPGLPLALALRGDSLYVAAREGGLLTYDVSTPGSPMLVQVQSIDGLAWTVEVDGAGAWVTSLRPHADRQPVGGAALHHITLGAEGVPTGVDTIAVGIASGGEQWTIAAAFDGPRAYVMTPETILSVVDTSDASAMRFVGSMRPEASEAPADVPESGEEWSEEMGMLEMTGLLWWDAEYPTVAVAGDTAYLAAPVAAVIDLSRPERPSMVAELDSLGYEVSDLVLDGNRLYALAHYEDTALVVLDISNPRTPRRLGGANVGTSASKLDVVGDTVYIAGGYGGGMTVVDVTDAGSPTILGQHAAIGAVQGTALNRDHVFIATTDNGVQHVALADALAMDLPIPGGAAGRKVLDTGVMTQIEAVGGVLLVGSDELRAYDIRRLVGGGDESADPIWSHKIISGMGFGSVSAFDDFIVYEGGRRLEIIEIDGEKPRTVASLDFGSEIGTVTTSGTTLYASETGWDYDLTLPPPYPLHSIDLRERGAPVRASKLDFNSQISSLAAIGTTLYGIESSDHLTRLDISNPRRPRQDGAVNLGVSVGDLEIQGDRMFTSHPGGWATHDMTDPRHPRPLTFTPAPGIATIRIVGDMVWLQNFEIGLIGYRP